VKRRRVGGVAEGLSCDAVRLAISARLDGELSPLTGAATTAHVADCEGCRHFLEGARLLGPQMTLRAARRPPEALKELLAGEWARAVAPTPPLDPGLRWRMPRPGWRRTVRWAGAFVPAAALVVALPLGALSAAQGKPTHASTPCTQNLHARRWSAP
jgi:predicted anti-sigma-YlaC factor YlaD